MKLLKNIFDADKSFDPFFVKSYLSQIVTTYLSEFYNEISNQKKLVQYINLLPSTQHEQNYGTLLDSTMSEIIAWQEKTKANRKDSEIAEPEKSFPMEMKDLKNLENVFTQINSQNIKKLLKLLDHSKPKVRRLMIIFFQILLKSKKAKKRMVDKCGLGSGDGLFMLNRLKDLTWDSQNELYLFSLLKEINNFIKNIECSMVKNKTIMKGTFQGFYRVY
jgi:uncharacterized membrane protein